MKSVTPPDNNDVEMEKLRHAFTTAIYDQDIHAVKNLLGKKAVKDDGTLYSPELNGPCPALHLAIASRRTAPFLNDLIRLGADPNRPDANGRIPLIEATDHHNLTAIKILIEAGAHTDAADAQGNTALIYAASLDKTACAQALLEGGADINRANAYGYTPLHSALFAASCRPNASYSTPRLLAEHPKIDLTLIAKNGDTVIDLLNKNPNAPQDLRDFIFQRREQQLMARENRIKGQQKHKEHLEILDRLPKRRGS